MLLKLQTAFLGLTSTLVHHISQGMWAWCDKHHPPPCGEWVFPWLVQVCACPPVHDYVCGEGRWGLTPWKPGALWREQMWSWWWRTVCKAAEGPGGPEEKTVWAGEAPLGFVVATKLLPNGGSSSVHGWMDIQNVVCLYSRRAFTHRKEWVVCGNMDKPWKHHATWKKPGTSHT